MTMTQTDPRDNIHGELTRLVAYYRDAIQRAQVARFQAEPLDASAVAEYERRQKLRGAELAKVEAELARMIAPAEVTL